MIVNTLEADGITMRYGLRAILSGIYIKSETGRITGLAGSNGCGKSTLMKIIFGILEPESKSIRLNNKHTPNPYKTNGLVTYMPQRQFLPSGKTIKSVFRDFDLSLDDFLSSFDVQLSDKDKIIDTHNSTCRLIEIYLVTKSPSLFTMLDEPFTHLSPVLCEQLEDFLLSEKQRKGIIVTDHNFQYLKSIADDLFLLNDGRLKHIQDLTQIDSYINLFDQ